MRTAAANERPFVAGHPAPAFVIPIPYSVSALRRAAETLGFSMGSEPEVGALLATLVASKPGGSFLELGTGTGLGAAWMLSGMDRASTLLSIDDDPEPLGVAERHLGADPRVTFRRADGGAFLESAVPGSYDLVFADAWPGKFTHLDEALSVLRVGGFYVIDDLLPQPTWPPGHEVKVERLLDQLLRREELVLSHMHWSTGVILATRIELSRP